MMGKRKKRKRKTDQNNASDNTLILEVTATKVTRVAALIAGGLVLCHLVLMFERSGLGYLDQKALLALFHLDSEANAPSMFSACLFLANAFLAAIVACCHKALKREFRVWGVLALVLCVLSLDEIASLHEHLVGPFRSALDTGGAFYFAWVIPYGVFVIVLAAYFAPVIWKMRRELRLPFFLAGAMYLSGAIGMEMIQGMVVDQWLPKIPFLHEVVVTVEESLEMSGLIILMYALLSLIQHASKEVTIIIPQSGFQEDADAAAAIG